MIHLFLRKRKGKMTSNRFLAWCATMGITDVCGDTARCFLKSSPKNEKNENPLNPVKTQEITPVSKTVFPEDVLSDKVQEMAASCQSLQELYTHIPMVLKDFAPYKTAAHTILGGGIETNPKVMVISEKPCAEEDKKGELFLGGEGQMLKRMLAGIGLSAQTQTYVGMFFPWRTPGDRKLTPLEKKIGEILIRRQIALVQPEILFLMGECPTELVSSASMLQLREKTLVYKGEGQEIPVRVGFSAKMVFENPDLCRKKAWDDLLGLKALLEKEGAL